LKAHRKKLLFFISEDWYFWSHRLSIAKAVRDSGWDVAITTRISNLKEDILKENIKIFKLKQFKRRIQSPLKEFKSLLELLIIYRTFRPNIVHHVALKPVIYGTIAARLAGVDSIVNALAGLGFLFTSEGKNILFFKRAVLLLLRFLFNSRKVQLIIQNTDDLNLMLSHNVVRKEQIVLIPGSGVDTQTFKPCPELSGLPVVLLPSRMLWDKGVKEFVQAANLLNSDGRMARFVLVGAPDQENPASITSDLIKKWESDGVIEWWGYRSDMTEVYSKSHIVCLPSYREGLPKVLLEAAATCRPIITTNTQGCKDVVCHGVNGFLVPVRNTEALVGALRTLLNNPTLRSSMGMRGRELVKNKFSQEKIVDKTIELYNTLVNQR
jgi:glycosyltransferase involved in cell wall biosynthesis